MMPIIHIDKGINVAVVLSVRRDLRPQPQGLRLLERGCVNARRAGGRSISLCITADRQPQLEQGQGTSPHTIWTCSGAYGAGPREGAPICSLSWAFLTYSQPPYTLGWFINQRLPSIPMHRLSHVWLMHHLPIAWSEPQVQVEKKEMS